jgi:hypothetical protein
MKVADGHGLRVSQRAVYDEVAPLAHEPNSRQEGSDCDAVEIWTSKCHNPQLEARQARVGEAYDDPDGL